MSVAQALLKCVGKTSSGPPPPTGIGTWMAGVKTSSTSTTFGRSTDNGVTWYPVTVNSAWADAELETNGATWYNPINAAPYRSIDNGVNWEIMPYQLASYTIPTTGTNWVNLISGPGAGQMTSGQSNNNLATFFYRNVVSSVTGFTEIVTGVYTNGTIVFFGTDRIVRSTDGGDSYTVTADSTSGFTRSAAANNDVIIIAGALMRRSTDTGSTWSNIAVPATIPPGGDTTCNCIAVNKADGVWIAGGFAGYVIRSLDNGITWSLLPNNLGLPVDATAFRAIGYNDGAWVITADGGYALRSINNGNTWSALPRGLGTGTTEGLFTIAVNNL